MKRPISLVLIIVTILLPLVVVSCQQQPEPVPPTPSPSPVPTPTLPSAETPTPPTPKPTPTPEPTPGKFVILGHSMSKDKDGMSIVSVEAKNAGESIIRCAKVTVNFYDSAGEWLFVSAVYKRDLEPSQTCNFEVTVLTLTAEDLEDEKLKAINEILLAKLARITTYRIEVSDCS